MNIYWILIPGILILIVGFLAFEVTNRRSPRLPAHPLPDEASEQDGRKL